MKTILQPLFLLLLLLTSALSCFSFNNSTSFNFSFSKNQKKFTAIHQSKTTLKVDLIIDSENDFEEDFHFSDNFAPTFIETANKFRNNCYPIELSQYGRKSYTSIHFSRLPRYNFLTLQVLKL